MISFSLCSSTWVFFHCQSCVTPKITTVNVCLPTKSVYNLIFQKGIHECWRRVYRECIANATNPCREEIKDAAVMSFCGPLEKVEMLGWAGTARPEVAVVTMLRHPVDRGKAIYVPTDSFF